MMYTLEAEDYPMVFWLLVIFIVLPVAELMVLLQFHAALSALTGPVFGLIGTILTVVGAGIVGAWLARSQGLKVLAEIQEALARGEVPTDALIDGALILCGGLLLLLPGFLSDIVGITFLAPPTRALYRAYAKRWLKAQLASGRVFVKAHGTVFFSSGGGGGTFPGFSYPEHIKRLNPEEPGDKPQPK